MPEFQRLLFVENQYTQFEDIRKHLEKEYNVFPSMDLYPKFIDLIRISLNDRNSKDRVDRANEHLIKMIDVFDPEMAVLDHILVGRHDGKNGINLAEDIRKIKPELPIAFFSRTQRYHVKVHRQLGRLPAPWIWLPKSFSNSSSNPEYLQEVFSEGLKQILPEVFMYYMNILQTAIDFADQFKLSDQINVKVSKIRKVKLFTEAQKNILKQWSEIDIKLAKQTDVKTFIDKL